MSENENTDAFSEFDNQLKALTNEMEQLASKGSSSGEEGTNQDTALIKGLSNQIESQSKLLEKVSGAIIQDVARSEELVQVIDQLKKKNTLESANQKLFDALHEELKSYKENALFEALQKPFIIDILSLKDELKKLLAQFNCLPEDTLVQLKDHIDNLSHQLDFTDEILARLSVEKIEHSGVEFDKHIHRAIEVEGTEKDDEDGQVAEQLKDGYRWRDKLLRPIDVRVKKYHKQSHD